MASAPETASSSSSNSTTTTTSNKCAFCDKEFTGTTRCTKCKKAYYCSKECQSNDWKGGWHRGLCDHIAKGEVQELARYGVSSMLGAVSERGVFALDQLPPVRRKFLKENPACKVPVLVVHLDTFVEEILCLSSFALSFGVWFESAVIMLANDALKETGHNLLISDDDLANTMCGDFTNKRLAIKFVEPSVVIKNPEKIGPTSRIYKDWNDENNVPCLIAATIGGRAFQELFVIKKEQLKKEALSTEPMPRVGLFIPTEGEARLSPSLDMSTPGSVEAFLGMKKGVIDARPLMHLENKGYAASIFFDPMAQEQSGPENKLATLLCNGALVKGAVVIIDDNKQTLSLEDLKVMKEACATTP